MKNNKEIFGIIYSAKCTVTGSYYIGATTDSLYQRKLDHEERATRGENTGLAKAIATYGTDAFEWTQCDTANTINELAKKEVETISKFDSKTNGYNKNRGGGFKKTVYQYNLNDGKLVDSYNSLEEAGKIVNAKKQDISRACLSVNKICNGFCWSYKYQEPFIPPKDKRKRKVIFYDFKNKTVQEFQSVSEASKITGVCKSNIARFCRGERKSPRGNKWQYI